MTPREEKFIELTDLSANLVSMADNQMGFSTDTDTTYNIKEGTPVWRTNNDLHVGAIQYDIDAVTSVATPADNVFGTVDIRGTVIDGTPRNGFNGKMSDVNTYAQFTFDNDTRVGTFSFSDARDTDYYANGVRCVIPDGDAGLTASPISGTASGWYTYYLDDDCQLKAQLDPDLSLFTSKCLVASLYYSPTNTGIPAGSHAGAEIAIFKQWHGAESVDWRGVHHNTEGTKLGCCNDFEVSTTSTPSVPTSVINMTEGTVWDEDIGTAYSAIDGTTDTWVVFYYEGVESGNLVIKRGPKTAGNLSDPFVLATDAGVAGATAGNIIYNTITYDVNGDPTGATVGEVLDGQYVLAHVFVANGTLAHNTIITGQNVYNSIEEARESSSVEVNQMTTGGEIISEAAHVASVILDNTGNIVPVNADGLMVADVRERENKVVFGSSNEVVVPDGNGYIKATRSISLGSVTTENSTIMEHLSGNVNEFPFIGSGGVIGAFDLLGAGGATEETIDTLSPDYSYIGPAYEEILSVTVPNNYLTSSFTYSLDMNLPNKTQGVNVRTLINSVEYETTLYDDLFGNGINIAGTIADGALSATDIISLEVQPVNTSKTFTVLAGSTLIVDGQLEASASSAYFILQENGIGTGTHTFDTINATTKIGISSTLPQITFTESDTTTDARIVVSSGNLYIQSGSEGVGPNGSGDIVFSGYNGVDVNSFRVIHGGEFRTIWHSGNDGTGSGLDADLLDGQHASYFATSASLTTHYTNDDHTQYHTDSRGDIRYYPRSEADSTFEPANPNIQSHISSTSNPHSLTLSSIGESYSSINYWSLSGSDVYRSSGNVGIGTSTPLSNITFGKGIHVADNTYNRGTILLEGAASTDTSLGLIMFTNTLSTNTTFQQRVAQINAVRKDSNNGSELVFYVTNANAVNGTPLSEAMRITHDSNLTLLGTIQQDSWTTATLLNSWVTPSGGGYDPASYRKGKDGRVYLRGAVSGGISSVIFTLPSALWPQKFKRFTVATTEGGVNKAGDLLISYSNGNVIIQSYPDNDFVSLDGVSFELD